MDIACCQVDTSIDRQFSILAASMITSSLVDNLVFWWQIDDNLFLFTDSAITLAPRVKYHKHEPW